MPYTIRKLPNKNCFRVMNTTSKKIHSKCTTRKNAEKQIRLLRAIEYNPNFTKRMGGMRMKTRKNYKNYKK